ncbi:Uncharacterized protein dnm_026050 [Desulfonema magnum]|uniref:Uncharacterized protein n=1 Tax=Desulfonema magnum TaxID=45655 RepID=A0A975BJG1_9BACT|nr:Uncharacterized protein dnm_026050 [Desulfonema magnum]
MPGSEFPPFLSPGGTTENSPAIHCREPDFSSFLSPGGTTENSPVIYCREANSPLF